MGANGFGFSATFDANGSVEGYADKLCEADILLTVGGFFAP